MVYCGLLREGVLAFLLAGLLLHQQVFQAADLQQTELFAQFVIARCFGLAGLPVPLMACNGRLNLGDAVAALLGDCSALLSRLGLGSGLLQFQLVDFGALCCRGLGKFLQTLVNQVPFESGKVRLQGFAGPSQLLDCSQQGIVLVAVGYQRSKHSQLAFGLEYGCMGTAQIIEVGNQRLNARLHLKRLQHVQAHKIGQVAHRFHGHGLVKQIQRLAT